MCYRALFRYHVTMLRAEFDKNKEEKDMMKVMKLVEMGEAKLKAEKHYAPIYCKIIFIETYFMAQLFLHFFNCPVKFCYSS